MPYFSGPVNLSYAKIKLWGVQATTRHVLLGLGLSRLLPDIKHHLLKSIPKALKHHFQQKKLPKHKDRNLW